MKKKLMTLTATVLLTIVSNTHTAASDDTASYWKEDLLNAVKQNSTQAIDKVLEQLPETMNDAQYAQLLQAAYTAAFQYTSADGKDRSAIKRLIQDMVPTGYRDGLQAPRAADPLEEWKKLLSDAVQKNSTQSLNDVLGQLPETMSDQTLFELLKFAFNTTFAYEFNDEIPRQEIKEYIRSTMRSIGYTPPANPVMTGR